MSSPSVSIIVPAYGQEAFALQAVRSALAQDHADLEVVFVDDASPQADFAAVRAIDDPRLRCFRNPRNLGRTGNYRHALYDLAEGDWVLVLDGDDFLTDPAFVRQAVAAGERDPGIAIVAGRAVTRSPWAETVSATPGEVVMSGLDLLARLPRADLLFMHMATLYRRAAAVAADFYRTPQISSDWESLYRLAARGDVAFIDSVAGVWRIHGSNASGSSNPAELGANLAIWPAIYEAAVAEGMPPGVARRACRRCLRFIIGRTLPAVLRCDDRGALASYLRQAGAIDPAAVAGALLSPIAILRIAAGTAGYYRRPSARAKS